MISFPQYYYYFILAILLFTLKCPSPVLAISHCTEEFWKELGKLNVSQHCHTNGLLRAEFGWTFNNDTRRLDIVFGTRLPGETGWLAWGLNLDEVGMVGTQALIGIKHPNGSLSWGQYNVTDATKRGCPLVPYDDIGLNVHNFSFVYLSGMEYFVIRATMTLPPAYNSSKTNVVCQMGEAVSEVGPLIHPFSLKHLDNTEKMNLLTNEPVSYLEHLREKLRKVSLSAFFYRSDSFFLEKEIMKLFGMLTPPYTGSWSVQHCGFRNNVTTWCDSSKVLQKVGLVDCCTCTPPECWVHYRFSLLGYWTLAWQCFQTLSVSHPQGSRHYHLHLCNNAGIFSSFMTTLSSYLPFILLAENLQPMRITLPGVLNFGILLVHHIT